MRRLENTRRAHSTKIYFQCSTSPTCSTCSHSARPIPHSSVRMFNTLFTLSTFISLISLFFLSFSIQFLFYFSRLLAVTHSLIHSYGKFIVFHCSACTIRTMCPSHMHTHDIHLVQIYWEWHYKWDPIHIYLLFCDTLIGH